MHNSFNPPQNVEYTRVNRGIRRPEQPAEVEPGTSTEIPAHPISERKRQANRKNAQRSTGPRTKTGKSRSRYNALKHGFFMKEMELGPCAVSEDINEANALHRRWNDHYQPVGPLEQFHVEVIVQCCWKMRRLERAESANIKVGALGDRNLFLATQAPRKSSSDLLDKAEKEVKTVGYIDDALVNSILEGDSMGEKFSADLRLVNQRARQLAALQRENPTSAGTEATKKAQSSLRASLQAFRKRLYDREMSWDWVQSQLQQPYYDRHLLPSYMDDLLRYQGAIDRRFYRAIAELEQLQRQRLGKSADEPLKLTR